MACNHRASAGRRRHYPEQRREDKHGSAFARMQKNYVVSLRDRHRSRPGLLTGPVCPCHWRKRREFIPQDSVRSTAAGPIPTARAHEPVHLRDQDPEEAPPARRPRPTTRRRNWIASHRRVLRAHRAGSQHLRPAFLDYRDDEGGWKRRPPVMIQAFRARGRRLPALLGARLRGLAAAHGRGAQCRASCLCRVGSGRHARSARHPERRRPAPARRQPRGHRPARPARCRRLPGLRRQNLTR